MNLGTVEIAGIRRVVLEHSGRVYDLARVSEAETLGPRGYPAEMLDLLTGGAAAELIVARAEEAIAAGLREDCAFGDDEVRWLAPIPHPPKVVLINSNRPSARVDQYETKWGGAWPRPQFLLKAPTAVIGTGEEIVIERHLGKVQPEGEYCLVIGRAGKHLSKEEALSHVFGIALLNDISASNLGLQDGVVHRLKGKDGAIEDMISRPLARAKGVDTFSPFGPWITPLADIPSLDDVHVTTRLAGPGQEPMAIQEGTIGEQRWSPSAAIAFITQTMTLLPGDVISMGSFEMAKDYYLRKGDLSQYDGGFIEIEASGVGLLRTPIRVIDLDPALIDAPL